MDVHDILGRCRRPLVVVNALDRLSTLHFLLKIYAVKVAAKLRSRPKKVVFGPRFVGEGIPQILDMRFQIAVCGQFSLSSVQRPRRLGIERKKKKESLVKHKSADILCRAANE